MKTEKQNDCNATAKRLEKPLQNRAMNSPQHEPEPPKRRPNSLSRKVLPLFLFLFLFFGGMSYTTAAVITNKLIDINIAALETKVSFTPTNTPTLSAYGLNVGPAKTITATNGILHVTLDAGTYTVCFPLIKGRDCITIEVPTGTNTYNFTNLITAGAVTVNYVGNRLKYEENGVAQGYLQFDP